MLLHVVGVFCMALIPGTPSKQIIKVETTAMENAPGLKKKVVFFLIIPRTITVVCYMEKQNNENIYY